MHVEMLMMSFLDIKIMIWLTSERQRHLICFEKIFVVYLEKSSFWQVNRSIFHSSTWQYQVSVSMPSK